MKRCGGIAWVVIPALLAVAAEAAWGEGQGESSATGERSIIFSIGQENKSGGEFRLSGLTGTTEFRCTVGRDCTEKLFPIRLEAPRNREEDYSAVERVDIRVVLERDYSRPVLRIARGGDETTVVKVDGNRIAAVTAAMLGSGESERFGAYDLHLRHLGKGEHTIELTVADDGKGNGHYTWDAIMLFGH